MRRLVLGVIALVLFAGGVIALIAVGGADRDGGTAASISIRAGVLLGAIWLAMPQLSRIVERSPPWLLGSIGVGFLMLIVRPRLITYVLPLFGVLLLIQFVGRFIRPLAKPPVRTAGKRGLPREKPKHSA